MKYFKGVSKGSVYPSIAFLKIDEEKNHIIEAVLFNEHDGFDLSNGKVTHHRVDVSIIQYNENASSTIYDMWNIDRAEITEKEFEYAKGMIIKIKGVD